MSAIPNEFEVPDGYTADIGNPLELEGIQLPFAAPYVYWQNGKSVFKQQGGAPYFGGWGMSDVDMAAAAANNLDQIPLGWTSYSLTNDQGKDYTAFMSRVAYVAILGTRFRWITDDTGRGKGQYQVLAYLAYRDEQKVLNPFSPVVLTTKATSGMFLREAVNKFSSLTAAARRQFTKNLPISAFYAAFGTFASIPVLKEVGKTQKKQVTPVSLVLPERIDAEYLRKTFVGPKIAELTAQLRKEAADWLSAWKQPAAPAAPAQKVVVDEPEYVPEPPSEDEWPF